MLFRQTYQWRFNLRQIGRVGAPSCDRLTSPRARRHRTTLLLTKGSASLRCFATSPSSDPGPSTPSWAAVSKEDRPAWSTEWKELGLGAELVDSPNFPRNLFFVQLGFGVDQHGDKTSASAATKACTRAVRNAIEFNSIPGVIQHIPGGRRGMLIHVKLGVPSTLTSAVDVLEVAKVFPYGKLLPIEVVTGGMEFATGRVVEELGDTDDVGICVVASVSIGYDDNDGQDGCHDDGKRQTKADNKVQEPTTTSHKTFNTKDGY